MPKALNPTFQQLWYRKVLCTIPSEKWTQQPDTTPDNDVLPATYTTEMVAQSLWEVPHPHKMEPVPNTAWVTKNLRLDSPESQGKTKYYCWSLKKVTKCLLRFCYAILIDQCLSSAIIRVLPPAEDGTRDPQPDIMPYTGQLFPSNPSLQGSGTPQESSIMSQKGWRTQGHLNQHYQTRYELKTLKQGMHGLYQVLCVGIMASSLVFMGFLSV